MLDLLELKDDKNKDKILNMCGFKCRDTDNNFDIDKGPI